MSITQQGFERSGSNFLFPTEDDNTVTEPKENWYDEEADEKKCHDCGNWYVSIGKHWSRGSTCDYPEPTDRQMEIMEGMLLGDGSIGKQQGRFTTALTNKIFVDWLINELGYLSSQNKTLSVSGSKRTEMTKNCDLLDDYSMYTHSNIPDIAKLRSWYENGENRKKYPSSIKLTPLKMKMWFVSDWSYSPERNYVYLSKANTNQEDEDLVSSWFEDFGWEYRRYEDRRRFDFTIGSTQEIFDYMGEPLDGMAYKWPDGPTYEEAKEDFATVNGEPYVSGETFA